MPEEGERIRLLLLPLAGEPALVPTAVVAEVTAYVAPDALPEAPPWVLGRVHWRSRRVPLVSLERALGREGVDPRLTPHRHMVVLHGVSGAPRLPYYAVVTEGAPRPRVAVAADIRPEGGPSAPFGWGRVRLAGDGAAEIPDLDRLEQGLAGLSMAPA